jgi:hypothetical protein
MTLSNSEDSTTKESLAELFLKRSGAGERVQIYRPKFEAQVVMRLKIQEQSELNFVKSNYPIPIYWDWELSPKRSTLKGICDGVGFDTIPLACKFPLLQARD